jgi:CBS domain-containing protein
MSYQHIIDSKPEAMILTQNTNNFYVVRVLKKYIIGLYALKSFKYFVFRDNDRRFLGAISADDLIASIDLEDRTGAPHFKLSDLVTILNAPTSDDRPLRRLRGFIDRDRALTPSADKKIALKKMDDVGVTWFPVVENYELVGVVEQSKLTASLILDVTRALERSSTKS